MKKKFYPLCGLAFVFVLAGCSAFGKGEGGSESGLSSGAEMAGDLEAGMGESSEGDSEAEPEEVPVTMCSIRISAGDTVLSGILYDNPTARGFADMLPLTVDLWHPAPDFARAFNLPSRIADDGTPGYEYELGSLAYWDTGPSIALIYKASREQTVVPVVPIGKITSDVSVFEEYGESVTVELEEDSD